MVNRKTIDTTDLEVELYDLQQQLDRNYEKMQKGDVRALAEHNILLSLIGNMSLAIVKNGGDLSL